MTSSLSAADASVIEPFGVPNTFPFASGPFASGPTASGERVRVIGDGRPNIQAGELVTAVEANELLFRQVRAGRGRPMALLRTVGLRDVRDKDPLKLSGGRRRVAAPRALVHALARPLIDEPFVEEITVEMPCPRHLDVVGGRAFGHHEHRTNNDPDAEAVAAAAGSAGQREDWR
jgi:hypothetical protein